MKILFITSGSIGDAILSTGILSYLADTHPSARFIIAAGPAAAPLFEAFPRLDRIVVIRKKPWNKHWLGLWRELWRERFELIVDLRGSVLSFLLRTKERKIFHAPDKTKSKAQQLAALLHLHSTPPSQLWASDAARRNAEALVPQKPFIVIAPKTNASAKDWPIERFGELAVKLLRHSGESRNLSPHVKNPGLRRDDMTLVVLAAGAQQASVQPLVKALPASQVIDLCGRTDLPTAYAILERAALFIGNDSGLLHMAAAAKIPCVGLYGPSNDKVYGPRGPQVKLITAREFAMGEKEKRDNRYMQMISVEQVERAAQELLSASATSSAA